MVRDNPETFADLDGHDHPSAPEESGAVVSLDWSPDAGQEQASQQQAAQQNPANSQAQNKSQTDKVEAAVVYSEKTTATPGEAKAMVSVIENRASSSEKQYVDKGKDVNVENVVNHSNAFQGVGGKNYEAFVNDKATGKGAKSAADAVTDVHKNGTTTDATSFIVNPGGKAPTDRQVKALGKVEAAKPDHVGDVYLYRPQ